MIVTLCRHEDGRPVAMIPATGKKEDCEVSEARSVVKVRREWEETGKPGEVHESIRHFITSVEAESDRYLGCAVRGHWSIENRNHHKRGDRMSATVTGG